MLQSYGLVLMEPVPLPLLSHKDESGGQGDLALFSEPSSWVLKNALAEDDDPAWGSLGRDASCSRCIKYNEDPVPKRAGKSLAVGGRDVRAVRNVEP